MRTKEAILQELATEQAKLDELEGELSRARAKLDTLRAELHTAPAAKPSALPHFRRIREHRAAHGLLSHHRDHESPPRTDHAVLCISETEARQILEDQVPADDGARRTRRRGIGAIR